MYMFENELRTYEIENQMKRIYAKVIQNIKLRFLILASHAIILSKSTSPRIKVKFDI
jgi:hypothetical protein